jgi:2-polyprenyl-3-methyl-5-hydroxy-6-metoxy-1,4-benzoquinol methylase
MLDICTIARRILRLCDWETNRDREYSFALRHIVGDGKKVIDIGGCDSLIPLLLARKGFKVTVFDFRKYSKKHPNLVTIQGDFLQNDLPEHLIM